MKKKSTLLVVLLTLVCLVCAAFGLTACNNDNGGGTGTGGGEGGNGGTPETIVIEVGKTDIGTVTTDGVTYSVTGEVNTVYKVTAKVGEETSNDVLISLDSSTLGTGFATFTYVADCKLTFTAVSEVVNNVTVVLEKYEEGLITPDPVTSYALTVDKPVVVDIKAGELVTVTVATEDGKTYTVTLSDENALFVPNNPLASNYHGPDVFDGSVYVDFDNVATLKVTATQDVTDLTITLSVKDTEEGGGGEEQPTNFPKITLDTPFTVSGASFFEAVTYVLEIKISGNYEFDTEIADADIVVSTEYDAAEGAAAANENMVEGDDGVYALTSNKYYVTFYDNGPVTVSPYTGGGEEEDFPTLSLTAPNTITGTDPQIITIYTLQITETGLYSFTGIDAYDVVVGSLTGTADYGFDIDPLDADEETGEYRLTAGKYYVGLYADGTLNIAKTGEWDGEGDDDNVSELQVGDNTITAYVIYTLTIGEGEGGNYTFTGDATNFGFVIANSLDGDGLVNEFDTVVSDDDVNYPLEAGKTYYVYFNNNGGCLVEKAAD